ncbi:GNAT family N-acetyltransferase [Dictyobacter kobayashii]|uniref:N-acetyltransferase domain-containing protein n=1 Tax=Dictyobacter kobayashii TaxID=2014872 RepID=A0A402AXE1_9CHLR|nr:GNAT family N-acetyltransferase [Dictyobacter kobayashii]GCE23755.1 hypothetical protein KDK_75550 [Dictyobacter kobayashii]
MTSSNIPNFVTPFKRIVLHFPDNQAYGLRSIDDSFPVTPELQQELIAICNEPLIYNRLFRARLQGQPYGLENSTYFTSWAQEGWRKNSWFVFLVLDPLGHAVAAVDIKSNNIDEAEIGYWASTQSRGIMTNTVITLCESARTAGYRRLYALVAPDNAQSSSVVRRAGFTSAGK